MKWILFAVGVVFSGIILISGCDNDLDGFRKNELTLSFATFNARLGDELPLREHREEKATSLLKGIDADIVCIQEVYEQDVINDILGVMKKESGHFSFLYKMTDNEDFDPIPPLCTENDIAPIMMCIISNCMSEGMDPACIITNCWAEFLSLPADCRNCMLAEGFGSITEGGDITSIFTSCMTPQKIEYKYSGKNGVLLASRYPMKDKGYLLLTSFGKLRSAFYATVNRPGIGDVQVICTGLSTPIEDMEYDGPVSGWQDEQLLQAQEILDIPVKENVAQRVIMGDFNGNISAGSNMIERNSGAVSLILNNGWYDPYFDVHRDDYIQCSVCPENPLVDDKESGYVPDHIFFRERKGFSFLTKRILLNEFVLTDEKAQTKTKFSVSDHYGISTTMTIDK